MTTATERKQKWQSIFKFGKNLAAKNKLHETDVMLEIKAIRKCRSRVQIKD
jgi:hypothetical protein